MPAVSGTQYQLTKSIALSCKLLRNLTKMTKKMIQQVKHIMFHGAFMAVWGLLRHTVLLKFKLQPLVSLLSRRISLLSRIIEAFSMPACISKIIATMLTCRYSVSTKSSTECEILYSVYRSIALFMSNKHIERW